jgi:hypothetical protein
MPGLPPPRRRSWILGVVLIVSLLLYCELRPYVAKHIFLNEALGTKSW